MNKKSIYTFASSEKSIQQIIKNNEDFLKNKDYDLVDFEGKHLKEIKKKYNKYMRLKNQLSQKDRESHLNFIRALMVLNRTIKMINDGEMYANKTVHVTDGIIDLDDLFLGANKKIYNYKKLIMSQPENKKLLDVVIREMYKIIEHLEEDIIVYVKGVFDREKIFNNLSSDGSFEVPYYRNIEKGSILKWTKKASEKKGTFKKGSSKKQKRTNKEQKITIDTIIDKNKKGLYNLFWWIFIPVSLYIDFIILKWIFK